MDRSIIDQFIWNGNEMNIDGNKMKNGMVTGWKWNVNGMELEWEWNGMEWNDYGM